MPKNAIRSFFWALLFSLLLHTNPFGLDDVVEDYSVMLIDRYISPFYNNEMADQITVILIDDAFLASRDLAYPLNYRELRRIVRNLIRLEPDAIFLDILQHYRHSIGFDRWHSTLKQSKIPIYLASDPNFDTKARLTDPNHIRHQLNQAANLVTVSWAQQQNQYHMGSEQTGFASVAPAIYQQWCKNNATLCRRYNGSPNSGDFVEPLQVRWSNQTPSRQQNLYSNQQCQQPQGHPLIQSASLIIDDIFYNLLPWRNDRAAIAPCPQLLTIRVDELLKNGFNDDQELKQVIQGKVVMLGYYLNGSNDRVESPIAGSLPGVYFHGVALENLMLFGKDYPTPATSLSDSGFDSLELTEKGLEIVALMFVFLYRFKHIEARPNMSITEKQIALVRGMTMFLGLIVISGISAVFLTHMFNMSITNLVALWGILIFALETLTHYVSDIRIYWWRRFKDHFFPRRYRLKRRLNHGYFRTIILLRPCKRLRAGKSIFRRKKWRV